ncbi:MAG: phage tail sheath subtilisin-like domain-containing protein [Nitrosomonas sp.]|jgi:phage tail sheath protein FI|uniref:phage tail sheath subtilisin-like domain-containing protein n=1 Tax=Nitrosomonas sp. TaxID=42353 RepID=UPI001D4FC287|nr:phage tail sheath subtilisin-like domain-containing protein [Nitrosomonas sp.]MBX9895598.1 phage tail sheath subtilisin-like domain-containing protein [Nitrosomonas sp.]
MAVQVDYPGVYIEEFTPGAPIEGVGTSTAAFLGTWKFGDPNKPIKLFSWDDFIREFGDKTNPSESLKPADNDYLYYAVRGFFQNGGRRCYVVRVSNAKAAEAMLRDSGASKQQEAIRLVARKAGNLDALTVTVEHVSSTKTKLFQTSGIMLKTEAKKGHTAIEVESTEQAMQFRPTDVIVINPGPQQEEREVTRIDGAIIRFATPLNSDHDIGTGIAIQLANPDFETKVLRLQDDDSMRKLTAGSVIKFSRKDASGNEELLTHATVKSVSVEVINATLKTWRVELQNQLEKSIELVADSIDVSSEEFKITIKQGTRYSKSYDDLSMNSLHRRYFANIINDDANGLVYAFPPEISNTTTVPDNRPKISPSGTSLSLTGGGSEDRDTIGMSDYQLVLDKLSKIDDINIVCAPGVTDAATQKALVEHCENTKDRFAVLDSLRGAEISGAGSVAQQIESVQSNGGYAALYFPWLQVSSIEGNRTILMPPSGHIAGVYARIDTTRGVHKAPAGIEATLNGVQGVQTLLSDNEQGELNKTYGVNVIRVFQSGGRPVVWGARTTATQSNKNWQYINVRRLFLFLEESIQESIQWAVFEPSNRSLWGKLNRTITAFLTQQWRDGALFGAAAKDAFFVRIDEALNPPDQQKLGRLTIEIGVKPVYPAEFIIVRIGIWDGGTTILQ